MTTLRTLPGGCHCGAVRFEVDVSFDATAAPHTPIWLCNCDGQPLAGVEPRPFDGQHWEQSSGVFEES